MGGGTYQVTSITTDQRGDGSLLTGTESIVQATGCAGTYDVTFTRQ
jgi:hypothetical protein